MELKIREERGTLYVNVYIDGGFGLINGEGNNLSLSYLTRKGEILSMALKCASI